MCKSIYIYMDFQISEGRPEVSNNYTIDYLIIYLIDYLIDYIIITY